MNSPEVRSGVNCVALAVRHALAVFPEKRTSAEARRHVLTQSAAIFLVKTVN
jgi:hypothetical protein